MDSTDLQLLALLRQDARATVATLANKLGVSRGTVSNRVKRLEDDGVITGYTHPGNFCCLKLKKRTNFCRNWG